MITRRAFLRQAALGAAALPPAMQAAIDSTQPMKITRIEAVTFRKDLDVGGGSAGSGGAEFCWVRLHTDAGLIGTGETYPFHQGEIGALRDYAPTLINRDPRDIDLLWRNFFHRMAMRNTGGADMPSGSMRFLKSSDCTTAFRFLLRNSMIGFGVLTGADSPTKPRKSIL